MQISLSNSHEDPKSPAALFGAVAGSPAAAAVPSGGAGALGGTMAPGRAADPFSSVLSSVEDGKLRGDTPPGETTGQGTTWAGGIFSAVENRGGPSCSPAEPKASQEIADPSERHPCLSAPGANAFADSQPVQQPIAAVPNAKGTGRSAAGRVPAGKAVSVGDEPGKSASPDPAAALAYLMAVPTEYPPSKLVGAAAAAVSAPSSTDVITCDNGLEAMSHADPGPFPTAVPTDNLENVSCFGMPAGKPADSQRPSDPDRNSPELDSLGAPRGAGLARASDGPMLPAMQQSWTATAQVRETDCNAGEIPQGAGELAQSLDGSLAADAKTLPQQPIAMDAMMSPSTSAPDFALTMAPAAQSDRAPRSQNEIAQDMSAEPAAENVRPSERPIVPVAAPALPAGAVPWIARVAGQIAGRLVAASPRNGLPLASTPTSTIAFRADTGDASTVPASDRATVLSEPGAIFRPTTTREAPTGSLFASAPIPVPADAGQREFATANLASEASRPLRPTDNTTSEPQENFAAPSENFTTAPSSQHMAPMKSFVSTKDKRLTLGAPSVGIDVAKAGPMSTSSSSTRIPAPEIERSVGGVASRVAAADFFTPIAPAPGEVASTAHRAVAAVLEVTDRFAAPEHRSVNLHFSVGGADLGVRVELRANEVHTTFRTDSAELRNALSHEWAAVTSHGGERPTRLAAPVFEPHAPSTATSMGGEGAPRDRQQPAAPAQTFENFARRSKSPANRTDSSGTTSIGSPVTPMPVRRNSLHLHTLA